MPSRRICNLAICYRLPRPKPHRRPAAGGQSEREAVAAADNAISLAPDDSFALSVKANAYFSMERWADAEEWAGRSLAADGDNAMAANLLAHALRMQGKAEENQAAVDRLLAADPGFDIPRG